MMMQPVLQKNPSTLVEAHFNLEHRQETNDSLDGEHSVEADESDPGINDAPSLSLTQFSLNELKAQMLQPKWSADQTGDSEEQDGTALEQAMILMKRLGRPKEMSNQFMKEPLLELESGLIVVNLGVSLIKKYNMQ